MRNAMDTLRPEVADAVSALDETTCMTNPGIKWYATIRAELLRLTDENARLLAANRDAMDHFEQMKAELTALKARIAASMRAYHSSFEYTLDASTLYARATGIPGEETYALVKVEE